MSAKYAENTSVPISRSQATLKNLVVDRWGAAAYMIAEDKSLTVVQFQIDATDDEMKTRPLQIRMMMPTRGQNDKQQRAAWRALVMVVKAKFVAIESGISTIEREFLPDIVMPNGRTIEQDIRPALIEAQTTGRHIPLLEAALIGDLP